MNVTLGNVLTGIVIMVLTVVATANLPGLLELTVLQRMHYLKGERYAITTIVRYAIAIVGFSTAFNNFGVGWSRIQWLVAALGVGLGFGLQEIFANFVSGIIILFERPIRVGDIVTVGGISGTVARIRTRATTIVDFERKELVVPNKDFITNQVVNWTLTDSVLRVTIRVGIAYGSNTKLAEDLLYETARENADALEDPAPLVLFKSFGESSLEFELRVFCENADRMLGVRHALNMAVERKFREAGIEIAFPQRDIHIKGYSEALPSVRGEKKPSIRDGGESC
jgi:potassium efflux system protein